MKILVFVYYIINYVTKEDYQRIIIAAIIKKIYLKIETNLVLDYFFRS